MTLTLAHVPRRVPQLLLLLLLHLLPPVAADWLRVYARGSRQGGNVGERFWGMASNANSAAAPDADSPQSWH